MEESGLSESEAIAVALLVAAAAVMTTAWLTDWARLTIHPLPIVVVSLGLTLAAALGLGRQGRLDGSVARPRLAAYLVIVIGCAAYLARLAWPSLLPISQGPDLVHHLQLIHFLQQRHVLPHDHTFGAYLGEMDGYTPGSHLLAAIAADLLSVDALRILYPLTVALVALKVGMFYNLLLRLLPAAAGRVPAAVAGTLLLLVPHAYFLRSFTHYYFYAQVVSETYAVAMLWAVVAWCQEPRRRWLWLLAVFGIAVVLSWPVWLPVPCLTAAAILWTRHQRSVAERLRDSLAALAPIALVLLLYSLDHAASAGILRSGGDTVEPSLGAFGWPFLALSVAGAALALRRRGALVPVAVFTAIAFAQIAALALVQRRLGATNAYLASKTVHLLVYGLAALAAVAVEAIWAALTSRVHAAAAWALPAIIAAALVRSDVPRRPLRSPITLPVHQAGLWAKANLPSPCVDYITRHWLTAYWLDVDVLGNPREAGRMSRVGYNEAVGRWILPGGLPFAIAEDVDRLPAEVRQTMRVRARFGPAAVLERTDGKSACTDTTPPIDRIKYGRR